MATWKQLQHTLALMAGCALLVPSTAWTQERPQAEASKKTSKPATKTIIPDIVLSSEGALNGSLIDGEKKPLAKTSVILKKDGKLVSTVETNAQGKYSLPAMKPGAYQLQVKEQTVAIRVWKPAAAPPKALKSLDMAYVPDADVVRAQFGYLDPVNTSLLLLGIAGVILGAVAVSEINDLQDDVNRPQSP